MRLFILSIFIIITSYTFSQFGHIRRREVFGGRANIEGKDIISAVYLTSIDSFNIKMELEILDDWKFKDTITENLSIDKSSINQNLFFIIYNSDYIPTYRYINENGFEIYLEKEKCHDGYNQNDEKIKRCQFHLIQVSLPRNKKFYVKSLPLMFTK